MLIYNLISYNIVCNTNTTTNANEIKALTRVESEPFIPNRPAEYNSLFQIDRLSSTVCGAK